METEHTETVVEKAVAYVKDMLGIPPGDRTPDVEAKPEYTDTAPELTSDDAMRLHPYTTKSVAEVNAESARREDELPNRTVDEHMQAAAQLDRAEGSVHNALDEIQDISRGMRDKIIDEKNPSYKDAADRMHDGKKLPPESEMQQAVERANAVDSTLIP
jgi:hypothetical protein